MNLLKKYLNTLTEFIAPLKCEVCEQFLSSDSMKYTYLCKVCFDRINYAPPSISNMSTFIDNFDKDDITISNAYCLFSVKDDFRYINLIHGLKYDGFTKIGRELSKLLSEIIQKESLNDYHGLIPVPIHHARLRERGFNQSDIIAKQISLDLGIPIRNDVIKRYRYTQTQTLLSSKERKINVEKAFKSKTIRNNLFGNRFLVIDDVLTTGSTINNIGKILLMSGAQRIDCATLAIA